MKVFNRAIKSKKSSSKLTSVITSEPLPMPIPTLTVEEDVEDIQELVRIPSLLPAVLYMTVTSPHYDQLRRDGVRVR
jgi:hypothetical protein